MSDDTQTNAPKSSDKVCDGHYEDNHGACAVCGEVLDQALFDSGLPYWEYEWRKRLPSSDLTEATQD